MDDNVAAADEYRDAARRLVEDDLPRFEAAFKEYLNTNTIRDIAGFHSELNKQVELISSRIATINDSLVGIDYNAGPLHPARGVAARQIRRSATSRDELRAVQRRLDRCRRDATNTPRSDSCS